jgi:hypothetical protein
MFIALSEQAVVFPRTISNFQICSLTKKLPVGLDWNSSFFSFLIIFICAYNVWVISPPFPSTPPLLPWNSSFAEGGAHWLGELAQKKPVEDWSRQAIPLGPRHAHIHALCPYPSLCLLFLGNHDLFFKAGSNILFLVNTSPSLAIPPTPTSLDAVLSSLAKIHL